MRDDEFVGQPAFLLDPVADRYDDRDAGAGYAGWRRG
jgi:hypothetical protein